MPALSIVPFYKDIITHWAAAGYHEENWSKPHSQKLYAKTKANPDDSTTLVRFIAKPMHVKNMNAVKATPRKVDWRGEAAAAGYDWRTRQ